MLLGFSIRSQASTESSESLPKMAIDKNENLLTTLARTVGTTAGVIVAKTTQLKDEVVKASSATLNRRSAKKPVKKSAVKKVAAKKTKAKKTTTRATLKKKIKKATRKRS